MPQMLAAMTVLPSLLCKVYKNLLGYNYCFEFNRYFNTLTEEDKAHLQDMRSVVMADSWRAEESVRSSPPSPFIPTKRASAFWESCTDAWQTGLYMIKYCAPLPF